MVWWMPYHTRKDMRNRLKFVISAIAIVIFLTSVSPVWSYKETSKTYSDVNFQNVLRDVKYLSSETEFKKLGYRQAGTGGERKAARYIEESFKRSGLQFREQIFSFEKVVKENSNTIKLVYKNGEVINPTTTKVLGNGNINGTVTGSLINLGRGTKKDFESRKKEIKGKFVLVRVDETTSADYFDVMQFGRWVKGIIAYVPGFEAPKEKVIANEFIMKSRNVFGEKFMTVITILKKDYDNLVKELGNKKEINISEEIKCDIRTEKKYSRNIAASKYGSSKTTKRSLIVIGAHYDCVNDSGAVDNGIGIAALMEMGRLLRNKAFNYDIKLVAFGAEEVGLFGSKYFVASLTKEELKRCRLMINLDGAGAYNVLVIGKSTGEGDKVTTRDTAYSIAVKNNYLCRRLEFPSGDHFNFSQVGVPTMTLASIDYQPKVGSAEIKTTEVGYHTFDELAAENMFDKDSHTSNDKYEVIERGNKDGESIRRLFKVVLGVLDSIK